MTIDANNNYWGSDNGPSVYDSTTHTWSDAGGKISDGITYEPYMVNDYELNAQIEYLETASSANNVTARVTVSNGLTNLSGSFYVEAYCSWDGETWYYKGGNSITVPAGGIGNYVDLNYIIYNSGDLYSKVVLYDSQDGNVLAEYQKSDTDYIVAWYHYIITNDEKMPIECYLTMSVDDSNIAHKIEKRGDEQYWIEYAYEDGDWVETGNTYESNPFLSQTNEMPEDYSSSVSTSSTSITSISIGGILSNIIDEEALKEYFRNLIRESTVDGHVQPVLAFALGASTDTNDIYHIDQGWWQSWGFVGYNDFYDWVFGTATDMNAISFPITYNSENVVIWAWKGDYINLGAGAELGIYYQPQWMIDSGLTQHWLSGTKFALPMSMSLYQNGNCLFTWNPDEDQWWINGFDTEKMSPVASELEAHYYINFSDNVALYKQFSEVWDSDSSWTFDDETHMATLNFKLER